MHTQRQDPQIVVLSALLYRLLLFTYPRDFRREYVAQMAQVFRDLSLREFHARGLDGMVALWGLTLIDYIKSVFEQHTQKGVHMNSSRLIRLGGWALMAGAAAMLVYKLAEALHSGYYPYDPANYFSNPLDPYLEALPTILLPTAVLLLTIGVLGLYQRYSTEASSLGRSGLVTSIAGGLLAFVVLLIALLLDFTSSSSTFSTALWYLLLSGVFLLFGGLFIFGLDAARRRLLPRWNYLPILTGIWLPLMILASQIYEAFTGNWLEIPAIDIPVFLITSLGLLALGYLLQSDAPRARELAMS